MEVIKFALIPMVWAVSSVYIVFGSISFLIRKIQRKDTRKKGKRIIVAFLVSLFALAIIGSFDSTEDTTSSSSQEDMEVVSTDNNPTKGTESVVNALGESRDNPFVLTADELASEILEDIEAAKEKYNGKWVMISGTIQDTSDGGIMYGYYLYGKRSTTGYNGLSIMCWCEDGPYSGSVLGDTQTFVGQLCEITTINVTEITDCEIIND